MTETTPTRELTLRGVVLAAVLTALFTAANVYAGLKVGLTFATSIPAAVISMAVLRSFKGVTIQENNIVQTIASAAGTLSAIVFVLPGLLMMGWWVDFPYWQSVAVIALGGILGVLYSVPLRRALVTGSDLPYPEGVAAAEVLKVGANDAGDEENKRSLSALIAGSLAGALYPVLARLKLVSDTAEHSFRLGAGATSVSGGLSLMLVGVGHLVGITVGVAMGVGVVISFFGLLPWLTAGHVPVDDLGHFVNGIFRHKVRFAGAGAIGIAAIWTLLKVIGPVLSGIRDALAADRQRKAQGGYASLPLTERDLPIKLVGGAIALCAVPIVLLMSGFGQALGWGTLIAALAYVLVAGLIIAAITGYMAGLIGASNSPVSGVGILTVLGIALILLALHGQVSGEGAKPLVAFALFVTSMVFGVATIANDNLQDLKTGQLVGATPWRQQIALVLGVVFGAMVIPPVLNLLNAQVGFVGVPGAGPQALAAPQASLIDSIAQGVLTGQLEWGIIALGIGIGVVIIALDEALKLTGKGSLPPLAVGLGMYLPMDVSSTVVVGAVIGWLYNRWAIRQAQAERAERIGVLVATGLIVGDSLISVAYSAFLAASGKSDLPQILPIAMPQPMLVGLGAFGVLIALAYARARASVRD